MPENNIEKKDEYGTIKIANEVVSIISGLAAIETEGVTGMTGSLTGDITEMFGMKNLSKGVKVEVGEKETAIDLSIVVDYGFKIHEVATNVQTNVKSKVEVMTGLNVVEVNINVTGVNIPNEEPIVVEDEPRVK